MTIRKQGGLFLVISKTGTILGTFENEAQAQAQESIFSMSEKKEKKKK